MLQEYDAVKQTSVSRHNAHQGLLWVVTHEIKIGVHLVTHANIVTPHTAQNKIAF